MTTAMKNDYITISIKKNRLKTGLQILGLIVTIIISYLWLTSYTRSTGYLVIIWLANPINPFIGTSIVLIIGSILGMLLFNRNKIPALYIIIPVVYSILMVLFEIYLTVSNLIPTDPVSMKSLDRSIIFDIFTLALGIVLGVISFFITKARKQLCDHVVN